MGEPETKTCPFCGEEIKAIAVRCKHCQADLRTAPPDPEHKISVEEFEQRFLEFAYRDVRPYGAPLNAPAVAYALKIPIAEAEERLDDLAARDVLVRDVDDEGFVFYKLPGRVAAPVRALERVPNVEGQLAPVHAPPQPQAMAGLLLNLVAPGVGSMVAGRVGEGVAQLILFVIALPLCFVLIGIPILVATWGWALATGIRAVNESTPSS